MTWQAWFSAQAWWMPAQQRLRRQRPAILPIDRVLREEFVHILGPDRARPSAEAPPAGPDTRRRAMPEPDQAEPAAGLPAEVKKWLGDPRLGPRRHGS